MGHCVIREELSGKKTPEEVRQYIFDVVSRSGDRYGTHHVQFLPGVKANYNEAAAEIDSHPCGAYQGYAVKYKDYSEAQMTKKMQQIIDLQNKIRKDKERFVAEHMPNLVKAEFIGCKACGSKISKKYMRGARCLVCGTDMRPESTLSRIRRFDERIEEQKRNLEKEKMKQKAAMKEKWLVLYSFHE